MSEIEVDRAAIADFCEKYHIRKLSLFGSALRGELRPDSDIDLLVEFEEGHVPGFAFVSIEDELSVILGTKADLRTPAELSHRFRDRVLAEALPLYES